MELPKFSSDLSMILFILTSIFFHTPAFGLASTDTITWGGDISRSGYQNNHNMDPAIVGSAQFGLIFKTLLPGVWPINGQNVPEQIFSQPLVYTGGDGIQYVYIATTQNNIYKMNAKTGVVVLSRNLHRPFLVSDLDGCVDINPTVGVTATGVIDPDTDTWYLMAKTYIDPNSNGPTGKPNGRYFIHAISTVDLSERTNFPVNLEGMVARNNPVRSFNGGIHHSRPALLHSGQYIYGGFASHCVQYNFTGWIVGWDKTTGQLVERFATEGAGVPNTVPGGGVWMSGGGIASDGKGSMFFATGNGYASQLNGIPVNGRNPPTSLEEAAVHMSIGDDGSLTVVDFFMPWEKVQLDGADRDLGTSPLELLPNQFQCGNITRMGVITGKSGKTYWLDLDNLGGYQNGPNKLDNVIQVYQNENSVYAGAGVYPLEGGYIYINVIQYQTHVFKFSCNNGVASFNKIADSPEKNAYILGVGHGTVTSLNDQPGTGLLWTSDVEGSNLRIYNAVPNNGLLTLINSFVTPATTKFTRPVFGDGIVYQGTTQGLIYAYGSPVNLPLTCSSPNFGTVNLNATSPPATIQCQSNTPLTVTAANLIGNPNFIINSLPNFPLQVAMGSNFSFQASFAPKTVGPLASSVVINTTQQAPGFSINTPVQLRGTGQSQSPLLAVSPVTVAWNGVITGQQPGGVNQTVILSNFGNNILSITSYQWSLISETGPWLDPASISSNGSNVMIPPFSFFGLPQTILPNSAVTVPINFNPQRSGSYAVYVRVNSDGGVKIFDVVAAGSDYPVAVLEFQKSDGNGWVPYTNSSYFTFGNVTENTSRYLKMRLTNNGTGNAAALSVTVSKPPFGVGGLIGANNQVDLAEGTLIYAGQSQTATLYCSAPKSQIDVNSYNGTAQWTMNLNDPSFGKQYIQFLCNAVSEQAPPLNAVTQQAIYRYAGCFTENNPGRQLQNNIYTGINNTNEYCISLCSAAGYTFAGTEYTQECWCGMNRPKTVNAEANCNFACTGNINEICGGNGIGGGGSFISIFGDITRWNGNSTDLPGPYVNPGSKGFLSAGCYTEASQGKALSVPMTSNNTVLGCLSACQGYLYSGLEYGGECYCGSSLGIGSTNASASDCNMPCSNNQTEYCGGPNRLNLYVYSTNGSLPNITQTPGNNNGNGNGNQPSSLSIPASIGNFNYSTCYTEGTSARALTGFAIADNSITLQTCASNCTSFRYFGVEYGRECFCGQSLSAGSVPATDGRCYMPCGGNSTELCGGPNGLTLFTQYINASATATTSTMSTPTPTIIPGVNSFQYVDCHSEIPGRALTSYTIASNDMTVQYCAGNCTGYTYMALEYGRECYCGNSIGAGSVTVTDGRCSMICAGDPLSICGGPNGLLLYQFVAQGNGSITITTPTRTGTIAPNFSTTSSLTTTPLIITASTTTPSTIITSTTGSQLQAPFGNSTTTPASSITSTTVISIKSSSATSTTTSRSLTSAPTITNIQTSLSNSTILSITTSTSFSLTLITTNTTAASTTSRISTTSITPITSSTSNTPTTSPTSIISITSTSLFSASALNITTTISSSSGAISTTTTTVTSLISSSTSNFYTVTRLANSTSSTSMTSVSTISFSNQTSTPSTMKSFSTSSITTTTSVSSATIMAPATTSPGTTPAITTSPRVSSMSNSTITTPSVTTVTTSRSSSGTIPTTLSSTLSTVTTTRLTTTISSSTTTTSSTTTISSSSLAPSPPLPNWTYLGCANESTPTRALSSASTTSPNNMTLSLCLGYCQSLNYPLAGTEYGRECYCGRSLTPPSSLGQTGCNMACSGNSSEICGGKDRLSVFNWGVYVAPHNLDQVVVPPGSGGGNASLTYAYKGCYTDTSPRVLPAYSFSAPNLTVEICVGACAARGYLFAGVEWGIQCFCANVLGSGGKLVGDEECDMLCGGDRTEWCGTASRLNVYARL